MLIEGIVGVVTGIVGSITSAVMNYKTQKLKNEHDVAMAKLEHEAMIAEAEIGMKVTEQKVKAELEKADAMIYKENIKLGNSRVVSDDVIGKMLDEKRGRLMHWIGTALVFLLGMADVLRTSIRPVLTMYLVGITSWITYKAIAVLSAKQALITATMAAAMFTNVTNIVIFLTVSAVTWWFGNRSVEKYIQNLKK